MSLNDEQRAFWKDALDEGVPEALIEEFEHDLDGYLDDWKTGMLAQFDADGNPIPMAESHA